MGDGGFGMGKNQASISGGGLYALELFDEEDIAQHKVLLGLENQKRYSRKMISKTSYLYRARRNTHELNTEVKSRTLELVSSFRSEALQQLLIQAASLCGLKGKVEDFLRNGKVQGGFGPLELQFLKKALEKMGWSKDMFVFD